jgi:hypothetical protein
MERLRRVEPPKGPFSRREKVAGVASRMRGPDPQVGDKAMTAKRPHPRPFSRGEKRAQPLLSERQRPRPNARERRLAPAFRRVAALGSKPYHAPRLSIRAALVTTSASSGVVGEGSAATGSIQSTASTSSLKRGSPLVQRATNEAMTK